MVAHSQNDILGVADIPRKKLSRLQLVAVITPIIGLVIASNVGNAIFPTLINSHPTLLIALNPLNRYLVLTVQKIDLLTFYGIGTLRLLAPDPFFYILGFHYGQNAISWMEKRTPTFGQFMRQLEKIFVKARYFLIVFMPNNPVCLLAGAAQVPVTLFFALNIIGTLGRLVMIQFLGDIFSSPISHILHWIQEYRIILLAISLVTVLVTVISETKKSRSEIQQLLHFDDAIEEDQKIPLENE